VLMNLIAGPVIEIPVTLSYPPDMHHRAY
jgi:hypothetical protein